MLGDMLTHGGASAVDLDLDLPLPCEAVSRGRQARRGIGMDADAFSSGQESCRKARPQLTDLSGVARQAPRRVAFSWLLLLATQEK